MTPMACSPAESGGGQDWLELSLEVPDASAELAAQTLLELGATGTQEDHPGLHFRDHDNGPIVSGDPRGWTPAIPTNPGGNIQIRGWFAAETSPATLQDSVRTALASLGVEVSSISLAELPQQDWNATWKSGFTTFRLCPRIQVVPSWSETPEIEDGARILELDPGMAFGTGTHFTTAGCATLLDHLLDHGSNPPPALLDVGTGTGILALAGLLCGAARAVAVDTDEQAIQAARQNAQHNRLETQLALYVGGPEAAPRERFPVVLANLIAPVLVELAPQLDERVEVGGSLIVSGILLNQEQQVLRALGEFGFAVVERLSDVEWLALRLQRSEAGTGG